MKAKFIILRRTDCGTKRALLFQRYINRVESSEKTIVRISSAGSILSPSSKSSKKAMIDIIRKPKNAKTQCQYLESLNMIAEISETKVMLAKIMRLELATEIS